MSCCCLEDVGAERVDIIDEHALDLEELEWQQEAPESRSFTCRLSKANRQGSRGFETDFLNDGCLQIVKIAKTGPLAESNACAARAGSPEVKLFDIIAAVNGKPATWKTHIQLGSSREQVVAMTVVRPDRLHIRVHKHGERCGVDLQYHESKSCCLSIRGITAGAFAKHNAMDAGHVPGLDHIDVGDMIESVNGVSGLPVKMMRELQMCEDAEMTILRVRGKQAPL